MSTYEGWHGWDTYAPFYDWENAQTLGRSDLGFWRTQLRRERGPVLELGCGTGRLLLPLSRDLGRRTLVGVDRSRSMLARASERARRRRGGGPLQLAVGDVRRLPFETGAFRSVIAAYGILQSLLSDRDLDQTLAEAARVLHPGGLFGVDLVAELPDWTPYRREIRLKGSAGRGRRLTLVETVRQDKKRGLTLFDEEYIEDTTAGRRRHRFRLAFRTIGLDALATRLERHGFREEARFGGYRGGRWDPTSPVALLTARKR